VPIRITRYMVSALEVRLFLPSHMSTCQES
jgi:hypothetical protein